MRWIRAASPSRAITASTANPTATPFVVSASQRRHGFRISRTVDSSRCASARRASRRMYRRSPRRHPAVRSCRRRRCRSFARRLPGHPAEVRMSAGIFVVRGHVHRSELRVAILSERADLLDSREGLGGQVAASSVQWSTPSCPWGCHIADTAGPHMFHIARSRTSG